MDQIIAIILREYRVRVRRRAFLISTLVAPLLLLINAVLPQIFIDSTKFSRQIIVLDQTGDSSLFNALRGSLEARKTGTRYHLSQVIVQKGADLERVRQEQAKESGDGHLNDF